MNNDELYDPRENPLFDEEQAEEHAQLWIVSYSDFMTIMMIFFLMCFAHRVWAKKVFFEDKKIRQERALRESQAAMIQRLDRLASIEVQAERIDIHLPDSLLFDGGKSDLRTGAKILLAQIAPDMKSFSGELVVEGHTDDVPLGPRSRYKSNWELSVARAFSVIKFLEEEGVPAARMSARGFGEFRPRAPNISPENRADNRRIEIILMNPKSNA